MWKLNNTVLNDQRVQEEIKEEKLENILRSENEETTYQNIWNIPKLVISDKFIPMTD